MKWENIWKSFTEINICGGRCRLRGTKQLSDELVRIAQDNPLVTSSGLSVHLECKTKFFDCECCPWSGWYIWWYTWARQRKQLSSEMFQVKPTPCQKTPSILMRGAADLACRITWCWVDLSAWMKWFVSVKPDRKKTHFTSICKYTCLHIPLLLSGVFLHLVVKIKNFMK